MNAVSIDIKDILASDSTVSLTYGTDLFIGVEPTSPNNTVTIFEGISSEPMLTYNKEERYDYPAIQIRIRNENYVNGYALSEIIRASLHGRANETVNGTYYSLIKCSNGPSHLDYDKNNRPRFIINFEIQRR